MNPSFVEVSEAMCYIHRRWPSADPILSDPTMEPIVSALQVLERGGEVPRSTRRDSGRWEDAKSRDRARAAARREKRASNDGAPVTILSSSVNEQDERTGQRHSPARVDPRRAARRTPSRCQRPSPRGRRESRPCDAHRVVAPDVVADMLADGTATVVCAFKDQKHLLSTKTSDGALRSAMGREDFERTLSESPSDIQPIVVVYCAAWSCNAAEVYCSELRAKHPDRLVLDYKGGLHEWSSLHFSASPHRFAFSADASEDDVRRIMASNQHVYHMRNVTNASRLRDCARAMAETGTQLVGGNTGSSRNSSRIVRR